tara:strand:- start:622 stop:849 length:228 start_codon:yes stop_codon:yes gene_type:complete
VQATELLLGRLVRVEVTGRVRATVRVRVKVRGRVRARVRVRARLEGDGLSSRSARLDVLVVGIRLGSSLGLQPWV